MLIRVCAALSFALLSGCSLPGLTLDDDYGDRNVTVAKISGALIGDMELERSADAASSLLNIADTDLVYKIGPRDVLQVIVFNHPELTNPTGEFRSPEAAGTRVRADGTIYFPFIGSVSVAGREVEDVRREIARRLAPYIASPQVDLRVAAFRSRKFYVTGEVIQPGIHYLTDEPLTILDAINLSGGFRETADLSTAHLIRNGQRHEVDLNALYSAQVAHQNIQIFPGDNLFVPDNREKQIFVLGEVTKQSAVPMHRGRMTLAEAIAGVEGFDLDMADPGAVYVLRSSYDDEQGTTGTNVYLLDASSADALLLADRFALQPRDVVFVSTNGLARWNRVVKQILPTVQTLFQTRSLIRDL